MKRGVAAGCCGLCDLGFADGDLCAVRDAGDNSREQPDCPYTTAVFLTLGAFLCCFAFNTMLIGRADCRFASSSGRIYFAALGRTTR